MRIIQTCSCGASLETIFTAPNSDYSYGEKREEKLAKEQIRAFADQHRVCLISKAADAADSPFPKPKMQEIGAKP